MEQTRVTPKKTSFYSPTKCIVKPATPLKDRNRPAAMIRPTAHAKTASTGSISKLTPKRLTHGQQVLPKHRSCTTPTQDVCAQDIRSRSSSTCSSLASRNGANKAICVAVRVRPRLRRELSQSPSGKTGIHVDTGRNSVTLSFGDRLRIFQFDHCFDDNAQLSTTDDQRQLALYESLGAPLIDEILRGVNCTLFTYGQTGTGKTYSILGTASEPGLIPLTCKHLLDALRSMDEKCRWKFEVSFFEIYNEKLRDLLVPEGDQRPLKVRDHPEWGVYVQGLRVVPVQSFDEVQTLIRIGSARRISACTANNDYSSRSHALFTVKVKIVKKITACDSFFFQTSSACLSMVDLAGSERLTSEQSLRETSSINKSLATLGMVIDQLSENAKFISHRDSVLTWLLKESLGGNARTTILATVSPINWHLDQTFNTLRYANRAKRMTNQIRVNDDHGAAVLKKLTDELASKDQLLANKDRLLESKEQMLADNLKELERLRTQMAMEDRPPETPKSATRVSVRDVNIQYELEAQKVGMNVSLAACSWPARPFLLLLSPDPQISDGLMFTLSSGDNRVGTGRSCDIHVSGSQVAAIHCVIRVGTSRDEVSIVAIEGSDTFVNGEQVEGSRKLKDGDRLCLAGEHYFNFYQSAPDVKNAMGLFEKSKLEYLNLQNQRLISQVQGIVGQARLQRQVFKRDVSIQQDAQPELKSRLTAAVTQTDEQPRTLCITPSELVPHEDMVAVDYLIREANSTINKTENSFRFSLAECRLEEGQRMQWNVKMENTLIDKSIFMPLTEFKDNWAALRSLYLCGKVGRFTQQLQSIFFMPNATNGRQSLSEVVTAFRSSEMGRTSIASFVSEPLVKDAGPAPTIDTPDSSMECFIDGYSKVSDMRCLAPKIVVDWALLSIKDMEILLNDLRNKRWETMTPCVFAIQTLHLLASILLNYPNALPGITNAVHVLDLSIGRFHNAIMSSYKATKCSGVKAVPLDHVDTMLIMLDHIAEALGSLCFVMPHVSDSHMLFNDCESCQLSDRTSLAFIRGAYYGYKHLRSTILSLCDRYEARDTADGRLKLKAVLLGLESLKLVARTFKTYEQCCNDGNEIRKGLSTAFGPFRSLMLSYCVATGFDDLAFRTEIVQSLSGFLRQLARCPKTVDERVFKSALQAIYPYLSYLQSMENNNILAAQIEA